MRLPGSTYRIQCRSGVTLRDVTAALDYLQSLGITDLYLSPIALARTGSTHGYDVCDPNRIDDAIGTDADLDELATQLRGRGMGLLLDIVPNHQAADESRNAWWRDVLARGPRSDFARCFDIDWDPPNHQLQDKVLLPVLDRAYGDAVDAGEIGVAIAGAGATITYQGRAFPATGVDVRADGVWAPHEVHDVLERQHYRLAHWRTATDDINYRRFFNIEHLVGVRVEDPAVFESSHEWLGRLIEAGVVTGLRIDHPDGLAAPAEYLWRLQQLAARISGGPIYIVVEKVLVGDERVPDDWPVRGTTGYEFLNLLNNLFVDRSSVGRLQRGYAKFVGWRTSFARTEYDSKKQVIEASFSSDLDRLVKTLRDLADRDLHTRDLTEAGLRRALVELTASLPVYRTYADARGCRSADLVVISRSLERVVDRRTPGVSREALQFISTTIARVQPASLEVSFIQRWQQFTSAVFAKAVEDRAFYRDNMLLSLNEVGGDRLTRAGTDVTEFHDANVRRHDRSPSSLLATTTHDTKLSEDVRARLHVLTEMTDEWLAQVMQWRRLNNRYRRKTPSGPAPDRHDEYRFYQLLVGLWPAGADDPPASLVDRLVAAMTKASREAARRTSWVAPDTAYEEATSAFVQRTMASSSFVRAVTTFAQPIARVGLVNSLAQTVLKIGSPGVPDFYQGTELCSLRMVDPDNRQPVDTEYRARLLADLRASAAAEQCRLNFVNRLLENWPDSAVKMFVTAEALCLRKRHAALFTEGTYVPLVPEDGTNGSKPEIVAFARTLGDQVAIVAAPRFVARVMEGGGWPVGKAVWKDVSLTLPSGVRARRLRECLTGRVVDTCDGQLPVADLLSALPVAMAVVQV